ncbi:MAG: HlyD family secretion protein [Cyanomargarita calcarea GSE-NOS-MK-12-04C]|jgi:HlyD family type I secretion membrane fusion protein|uniref:HlyD family secretion protein n=1 Tax=Cyanomargarita calcarea GSE-NOS-MK-12-04C TaxID=2839659 RepID=A0A951QM36_9CYAN|nr:HlyD family secretion protein [Cyanomargarita calcarea GSE-NOS-MK-12-04C]
MITSSNTNPESLPSIEASEFIPPISRWTSIGGIITVTIVGITLALASVIKYRVTIKGEATVRPTGELRLVQAAASGSVRNVAVKENQRVKLGDAIATIDNSQLQTKKNQLESSIEQIRLQLVQINTQISMLNRQLDGETKRINRSVGAAKAELGGRHREYQERRITVSAEVQEASAMLNSAKAALGAAKVKLARYQPIAQAGALPKNQLDEAQLDMQQQEQAVAAARAKLQRTQAALNPSNAPVAIATERVALEQASGQANLATLTKEREALIQQQIEAREQLKRNISELQQVEIDLKQTTITATASGIITKLNIRNPGQTVSTGAEVAQIVPSAAPLQVKASVSPQERNRLKAGQKVHMRVSACPYPDYGTLKGVVSIISEDTHKLQADNIPAFYEVTIKPERYLLSHGDKKCSIQLGMQGRVDIISREETVLQFFLREAKLIADF